MGALKQAGHGVRGASELPGASLARRAQLGEVHQAGPRLVLRLFWER